MLRLEDHSPTKMKFILVDSRRINARYFMGWGHPQRRDGKQLTYWSTSDNLAEKFDSNEEANLERNLIYSLSQGGDQDRRIVVEPVYIRARP